MRREKRARVIVILISIRPCRESEVHTYLGSLGADLFISADKSSYARVC